MSARTVTLIALASFVAGCTTLASSPSWVGGTLADGAPERIEREEIALKKETALILSEPKTIGAKHILVMHSGSERKPPTVTRTKAEAKARAEEALAKVRGGADFDKAVVEYSDEPGATERAGDLGVFEKKVMVKAFSDAAFKLKVGEVSEIVETPFGFHIIKRTN
ncbi:MAG: peptidylprolyl isomerase [Myxococcales bacterium]|nr:peptidylprolyl isomerase [Myxococcales bacterium]